MKYSVTVHKVLCGELEVEAESYDDALELVERKVCIDQDVSLEDLNINSEHWEIPDLC